MFCKTVGRQGSLFIALLLPAGILPHLGGQDLHYLPVVFWGVLGNALQGVDSAQLHREFVVPKLVNGTGEPLSNLLLLGHFYSTPFQLYRSLGSLHSPPGEVIAQ